MRLIRLVTVLIISCLFSTTVLSADSTPPNDDVNKLVAGSHHLAAVYDNLEKVLYNDGAGVNPKGLVGRLRGLENQVEVVAKQTASVLAQVPPAESIQYTPAIQLAVSSVGELAVQIADRCELGFEVTPDSEEVSEALSGLKRQARALASSVEIYLSYSWEKLIPVRFVQVHDCYPWLSWCEPNLERESIDAAVDGMNEAYAPIGIHFWTRSVERFYMYSMANESFPKDTDIEWWRAADEIGQVFDIPDFTPPDPDRDASAWLVYASTIFSDPRELLVWVFARDSLVARQIDGHSIATFPHTGRALIITSTNIFDPNRPASGQPALSPYHLAHESGHFFGLPHPWEQPGGPHPLENREMDWADLWDLSYCAGDLGFPLWFNSRAEALALGCSLAPIEDNPCPCGKVNANNECTCPVPPNCRVDNRFGLDDSDMECSVLGSNYYSGHGLVKGLSFDQGEPESPPDSFAWGLNVMGYYSRYNAHLWTPGRFSVSQLETISAHASNSVPIVTDYEPYLDLTSQRDLLGTH